MIYSKSEKRNVEMERPIGVKLLKLASLLCIYLLFRSTISSAEDQAMYTEFLPGAPPSCQKPILNTSGIGTTLEACEKMYKNNDFAQSTCETEARVKQRTAPDLLEQYEAQWLANLANRKEACLDLLAEKGRLGMLDIMWRWWNILR
jgi:hypothetical protein